MKTLDPQWLFKMDIGANYISIMVGKLKLPKSFRAADRFYPFIKYLDFFQAFDIVKDDHLFATNDGDPASFARVKPTHTDMGQNIIWEDQWHIGYVLDAFLNTSPALGAHLERHLSQEVNHNWDIMGSQVPNDIERWAEQSQAGPHSINIVNLAKLPTPYHFSKSPDSSIVFKSMADH